MELFWEDDHFLIIENETDENKTKLVIRSINES